ncbi:hypothetical protein FJT64_027054 [Amphibalanus amphitrite]|uniref:Uncharacterized protein n=1 Tax=Amphibalanus amphitrite TaxID=1232801 RepID=A0A6A4WEN9_AMPAM|nr:hypothetical protein FJT64_027054 [Amphibalanus amphitrite]
MPVKRCDSHGITLNPAKVTFAAETLDFCGYVISPDGYTADQRKKKAEEAYNERAKPLRPLRIGAHVSVQDSTTGLRDKMGLVVGIGRRRDYLAEVDPELKTYRSTRGEM